MKNAIFRRALGVCFGGAVFVSAMVFGGSPAHAQDANAVVIKNFMFEPMAMTVKAGSTVTWKNLDGEPHTVVNDAGIFRSAALDQNDTYQFKFDKPGVYKVFCGIHPNMKEVITVQ
ncbi:cupredoxin domain-containing protein [Paraburkholderia saeva]|uniref:cupredoxin domain-containing protein n=1 Tax=Paraburkholderia saeva TaxID=2777537 RepID=UPI001D3535A8|nr:cupredoxin domain-containing protein [Paraburkholderia saeva]CAG4924585.1 hypothetical protein R70241_05280 [Paraburkholderia saeva]